MPMQVQYMVKWQSQLCADSPERFACECLDDCIWHGMAWRGVVWYGWMIPRACSERLFERGRGGAVWDRLEPNGEAAGAKSRGAACMINHGRLGTGAGCEASRAGGEGWPGECE
jgi:hypothetical protein